MGDGAGFALATHMGRAAGIEVGLADAYWADAADALGVRRGLFKLKGPQIKQVRALIAKETDEFVDIVKSNSFLAAFQELKGNRSLLLDKHLQSIEAKTSYIANKQFYAMKELPLEDYLGNEKVHEMILMYFKEIAPLNNFLKKAFE